jgi:hypothetical protein
LKTKYVIKTQYYLAKTRKNIGGRWRNLTESKKIIVFELEQTLSQALKECIKEESEPGPITTPFKIPESDEIDKKRMIKRWKKSAGYYNLNPDKFRFSLKNL